MVSIFLLKLNYWFRTGWQSKIISYVAIQYSLPFFLLNLQIRLASSEIVFWSQGIQNYRILSLGYFFLTFCFSFSDNTNR